METPLKFKFSERPNSGFGTFFTPYYTYSSQAVKEHSSYRKWDLAMSSLPGFAFTQYEPPSCGGCIIATTTAEEDFGKEIAVSGSYKGMKIAPKERVIADHDGELEVVWCDKTDGEILQVQMEEECSNPENISHHLSSYTYDKIDGIYLKGNFCDYVTLHAYDDEGKSHFLGHLHPDDKCPKFRRATLTSHPHICSEVCIHILGRISPYTEYKRGTDVLPISSLNMLKLLARRAGYNEKGDINEAAAMKQEIKDLIRLEVAYQQEPNRHLSMGLGASGGTIRNL